MKHHVVAFRNGAHEVDALARVLLRHPLEVLDECLLAIGHAGIVLNIDITGERGDRFRRPTLIEHEVVEGHGGLLVSFELA
jgi:hypothetical protein